MKPRFVTLFIVFTLFSLVLSQINGQSENTCPIDDILTFANVLVVEHSIPHCRNELQDWESAINSPLEGGLEKELQIRYNLYLGLIAEDNATLNSGEYFPAREYYSTALALTTDDNSVSHLRYIAQFYFARAWYLGSGDSDDVLGHLESVRTQATRAEDYIFVGKVYVAIAGMTIDAASSNVDLYDVARRNLRIAMDNLLRLPTQSYPEQIEALTLLGDIEENREHFDVMRLYRAQVEVLRANPNLYNDFIIAGNSSIDATCVIISLDDASDFYTFDEQLLGCQASLTSFEIELNGRILATNLGSEDRAYLQTLLGIVYFHLGEYNSASREHGRTITGAYANNPQLKTLNYYYTARAYEANRQSDAEIFYMIAIEEAEAINDLYLLGLSQLGLGRYYFEQLDNPVTTIYWLDKALDNLRVSDEATLEQEVETLQLLVDSNRALGDEVAAQNSLRSLLDLTGNSSNDGNLGINRYRITTCHITSLYGIGDILIAERHLSACKDHIPALILTAHAIKATASDPAIEGMGLAYMGIAYSNYEVYGLAQDSLGDATEQFRESDTFDMRGASYVYLIETYFANGRETQGRELMPTAESFFTGQQSDLDKYYLSRLELVRARDADEQERFRASVDHYELANSYLVDSGIPSCDERIDLIGEAITVLRKLDRTQDEQDIWQQQLANLIEECSSSSTPTPTTNVTSTATVISGCDIDELVSLDELVDIDRLLGSCQNDFPNIEREVDILRAQAHTSNNISGEVFYLNYLGIINLQRNQCNNAKDNLDDAVVLVQNNNLDPLLEALSYVYYGRAFLACRNFELARSYFATATGLIDNPLIQGLIDESEGQLAFNEGRYDEALDRFTSAATNYEASQYDYNALPMLLRVGNLNFQRSNFTEALNNYESAARLAEALNDTTTQVRALIGESQVDKYHGRYTNAHETLEPLCIMLMNLECNAILSQEINISDNQADAYLVIAELADLARLRKEFRLAEGYFALISAWTEVPCEISDVIRLYHANYLTAQGFSGLAIEELNPLTNTESCRGRNLLTNSRAQNAITNAYLALGITSQATLNSVNEAITAAQAADQETPENRTGSYPVGFQTAYINRARFEANRFNFQAAEADLEEAERRANMLGDMRATADIALIRANMLLAQGLYDDALTQLGCATEDFNEMEHDSAVWETLELSLQIYLNQANYTDAETLLEDARTNFNADSLPVAIRGLVRFYSGQSQEQQGLTSNAANLYDSALLDFEEADDFRNQVNVKLRIIELNHRLGNYPAALDTIAGLRGDIELRSNEADESRLLWNAQVDLLQGDNLLLEWVNIVNLSYTNDFETESLANALDSYEQALGNILEAFNVNDAEQSQNDSLVCANLPTDLLDLRLAEAYNRLGELYVIASEYNVLNEMNLAQHCGNLYLNNAWTIYNSLNNQSGIGEAVYNLGRYRLFRGEPSQAIGLLTTAEELTINPYLRALIWTHIGLAREEIGDPEAIDAYQEAADLISFTYAEINDSDAQRSFGTRSDTLFAYNRLVHLYLNQGSPVEALNYAEQSRARSYLTQLQDESANLDLSENPELQAWLEVRDELSSLSVRIDSLLETANSNLDDVGDDSVQEDLNEVIADREERLEELASLEGSFDNNALAQLLTVNVASTDEIRASLPDETVMLVYYVLPPREQDGSADVNRRNFEILIFVISKTNPVEVVTVPITRPNLNPDAVDPNCTYSPEFCLEIVNRIKTLQITQGRAIAPRNDLSELLIHPVASYIEGYNHLVIVPHSEMHYLPFELLTMPDGQQVINDFYSIHYAPSATVYTLLQELPEQSSNNALLLAYSGAGYEDDGLTPLDNVDEEIEAITGYFSTTTEYIEADATRERLYENSAYDVIHLAAHGSFNSSAPLNSFIALGQLVSTEGTFDRGHLRVSDIYGLSFDASNPMIVVSACHIATNDLSTGDELEGFSRAFLLTGARSVVASLWAVDDTRAEEFMTEFYRLRYELGMNNAEALTEAKRIMISTRNANTADWAGFVLIGRAD